MTVRTLLKRLSHSRKSSRPQPQSRRLEVERLEGRTLPSVIVWNNRGNCVQAGCPGGTSDSDGFFANYGANAAPARTIAATAISAWQNTIQNFNYRNVGQTGWAPIANLYGLSLSAGNVTFCAGTPGNYLGCGGYSDDAVDPDGRPWRGSLTMDDDGAGSGWYFDPDPSDHGEFTNLANRFAATGTMAGVDFYTVVLHEVGHTLGFLIDPRLRFNTRVSNPGLPAPNTDLRVFTFLDNSRATLTTNGGGHTFDRTPPNGYFNYPNDLMNPSIGLRTRRLISDLDARLLGEGQGYTVTMPSTRETFLATYRAVTRGLTVNGDPQVSNNTITLDVSGSDIVVNVDGVLSRWAISAVSFIIVNAGSGDDTVDVRATRNPLAIEGVGGLDDVFLNANAGGIQAYVTVGNSGGYTALTVDASAFAGAYTATLSESAISFGGVQINYVQNDLRFLTLRGGSGNNTYNIINTPASSWFFGLLTTVVGGAGVDTMNVQRTGTTGQLSLNGNGGLDNVLINANTGGYQVPVTVRNPPAGGYTALTVEVGAFTGTYTATISDTSLNFGGIPIHYVQGDLRSLTLNGGSGNNTYNINSTPSSGFTGGVVTTINAGSGYNGFNVNGTAAGTTTILNGGMGDDAFAVGENSMLNGIDGNLRLDGRGGWNFARVSDWLGTVGRTYTWTGSILRWSAVSVESANLGYMVFAGGRADDTYYVQGTAPIYCYIADGGGNDTLAGPDTSSSWVLRPATEYSALAANVAFIYLENLVGGAGDDTFAFANGASVAGYILGGGGQNKLDYSAYTTNVYVNLPLYTATGVGWFIYQIRHADGGAGNDILVGDEQSNTFSGGPGRDLLIGGGIDWNTFQYSFQPDYLAGGDGDDILIGGFTYYDFDTATLQAIRDQWAGPQSYTTRVGLVGAYLNTGTVYSNYAGNTLLGGAGLDLFFGYQGFDVTDWDSTTETFIHVG